MVWRTDAPPVTVDRHGTVSGCGGGAAAPRRCGPPPPRAPRAERALRAAPTRCTASSRKSRSCPASDTASLRYSSRSRRARQRLAEEPQPLAAPRLDEGADEEPIDEAARPRSHEAQELLGVRVPLVGRQRRSAAPELDQHRHEVLLLLLRQPHERPHQLRQVRVLGHELQRGRASLLLAVRVVTHRPVEVGERDGRPARVGGRAEDGHGPFLTSASTVGPRSTAGAAASRESENPATRSRGAGALPAGASPDSAARSPTTAARRRRRARAARRARARRAASRAARRPRRRRAARARSAAARARARGRAGAGARSRGGDRRRARRRSPPSPRRPPPPRAGTRGRRRRARRRSRRRSRRHVERLRAVDAVVEGDRARLAPGTATPARGARARRAARPAAERAAGARVARALVRRSVRRLATRAAISGARAEARVDAAVGRASRVERGGVARRAAPTGGRARPARPRPAPRPSRARASRARARMRASSPGRTRGPSRSSTRMTKAAARARARRARRGAPCGRSRGGAARSGDGAKRPRSARRDARTVDMPAWAPVLISLCLRASSRKLVSAADRHTVTAHARQAGVLLPLFSIRSARRLGRRRDPRPRPVRALVRAQPASRSRRCSR